MWFQTENYHPLKNFKGTQVDRSRACPPLVQFFIVWVRFFIEWDGILVVADSGQSLLEYDQVCRACAATEGHSACWLGDSHAVDFICKELIVYIYFQYSFLSVTLVLFKSRELVTFSGHTEIT